MLPPGAIGARLCSRTFKHPQSGAVERQPFALAEAESRFEALTGHTAAFRGDPEAVTLVAEAYRLQHAYLFNPLFATETSLTRPAGRP